MALHCFLERKVHRAGPEREKTPSDRAGRTGPWKAERDGSERAQIETMRPANAARQPPEQGIVVAAVAELELPEVAHFVGKRA